MEEKITLRINQLIVALSSLAALTPPEHQYDEEGNDITDPALIATYEQEYSTLRTTILTNGGADFSAGITISGYDPLTVPQLGLTACLKVTLQIAYSARWLLV